MNKVLTDGILAAAAAATGFSTNRTFWQQIPLKASYPYVVIFGITETPDRDALNFHEEYRLQFAVRDKTLPKVQTAGLDQKNQFDQGAANITITGYSVIRSDLILEVGARPFNNVWTWDMDFIILITKLR